MLMYIFSFFTKREVHLHEPDMIWHRAAVRRVCAVLLTQAPRLHMLQII
jgi:hypothetical protein